MKKRGRGGQRGRVGRVRPRGVVGMGERERKIEGGAGGGRPGQRATMCRGGGGGEEAGVGPVPGVGDGEEG